MSLTSAETPLKFAPLSVAEASMVVSLLCAGGVLGTVIYAYLIDKLSRRMLLVSLAVPQVVSKLKYISEFTVINFSTFCR